MADTQPVARTTIPVEQRAEHDAQREAFLQDLIRTQARGEFATFVVTVGKGALIAYRREQAMRWDPVQKNFTASAPDGNGRAR